MSQKEHSLQYHDAAREELLAIAQLHLQLVGPISARKITDRIKGSIDNLCTSPNIGILCQDDRLAAMGYRYLICGNYLCFYRPINDVIYIYHVVDGRTDYNKLLTDLQT